MFGLCLTRLFFRLDKAYIGILQRWKSTVEELAKHRHGQNINGIGSDGWNGTYGPMVALPYKNQGTDSGYAATIYNNGAWGSGSYRVYTDYVGSNKAHNNIQPSKAVYAWIRTA